MKFIKTLTEEEYKQILSTIKGLTLQDASASDLVHAAELHVSLAHHHTSCFKNLIERAEQIEINRAVIVKEEFVSSDGKTRVVINPHNYGEKDE